LYSPHDKHNLFTALAHLTGRRFYTSMSDIMNIPSSDGKSLKWNRIRRVVIGLLLMMALVYLSFGGYVWWAMHQSPEVFGRVMAKTPGPIVFLLYPFETLWVKARTGTLNIGDAAPDFSLSKVDKTGLIQLSGLNKKQPVVLVFGSYT
jgi:hypothetical protein